jgi:hypothetical protein
VLRLRERVWTPEYPDLTFVQSADRDFPTWWTAYPNRAPLVVGWRGGPAAATAGRNFARDELESRAVSSLARQLSISRQRLRSLVEGFWTHDWEHEFRSQRGRL